ncbi:unnamed protein product, partial [Rotaria sp. Silwood2]
MAFWRSCSFLSSTTSLTTSNNNNRIDQEAVKCLCDDLKSATHMKDRQNAILALKTLSKKYKHEVGTQSMTLLANILQDDQIDLQLSQLILETLLNIITYDADSDKGVLLIMVYCFVFNTFVCSLEQLSLSQDISVQFTKLYIKNKEHVHTVLELIAKTNFNVRCSAIRFLTALLTNYTPKLQDIIYESGPVGFSKLLVLLEDKNDVILNDALSLFKILTRSNAYIQGVVAFENGFERLLQIIIRKCSRNEDVIITECLSVLLNLLENNESNQMCFRGNSYIPRLFNCFDFGFIGEKRCWSTQKVTNVRLLLKIIRTVISPTNLEENIVACQRTVSQF